MEIRFNETFDSGEISVYLTGPLSVQTYDNVSHVMEAIRKQLVSLIAPQGFNPVAQRMDLHALRLWSMDRSVFQ